MSSRIRTTLNAGIAAFAIGTAAIGFASTPASAFSLGGLGHISSLGGMGHTGGLGSIGHAGGLGNLNASHGLGNAGRAIQTDRVIGLNQHQTSHFGKTDAPLSNKSDLAKFDKGNSKPTDSISNPTLGRDHVAEKSLHGKHAHGEHDHVFVPGFDLIVTDDTHVTPHGPVFADGPGKQEGGGTVAEGPNANTPDQIVKVDKPCDGAVLRVSTATSSCVEGFVQISGNEYYFCPSKNQFEVRHYAYTPVPKIACDGKAVTMSTLVDVLPQKWVSTRDTSVHACVDTGRTITQWVTGATYWEKLTWHVYKCFDNDGQEVYRLFPTPDREVSTTSSSSPEPITANDLKK